MAVLNFVQEEVSARLENACVMMDGQVATWINKNTVIYLFPCFYFTYNMFVPLGQECEDRLEDLPKFIADDFTTTPSNINWKRVVGGKISEICGPIASGEALHFYGVTTPLYRL